MEMCYYWFNVEEIVGKYYEKELQKTNQKWFRIEKVIRRKDNELNVKWKVCDNSFISWINRKQYKWKVIDIN